MIQTLTGNDLSTMTCTHLAERCAGEQDCYHRRLPADERYGLELFRRAIAQGDEAAWRCIQERFTSTVLGWLLEHPGAWRALEHSQAEELVADAWSKFWVATRPTPAGGSHGFASLAHVLAYLRLCLNSVVMDTLRQRQPDAALDPNQAGQASDLNEPLVAEELWAIIEQSLPEQRERQLAQLILVQSYKPRQIVALVPQEFPTAQAVYRLWRNIVDRLRRTPRLRQWCELGEP